MLNKMQTMTTIKFKTPGKYFNPLSMNDGFIKIPNKPGVYIWGYWIMIEGKKTFCPMNIGEAGKGNGNLRSRLIYHYCTHFENKDDGIAAFFEINKYMSQENIDILYKQLSNYCKIKLNGNERLKQIKNDKQLDDKHKASLSRLIFYQDKNFFDSELAKNYNEKNIGLYSLVEFLKTQKSKGKLKYGELLNKIIERQEIHINNFFCIYAIQDNLTLNDKINKANRTKIENTVNKALNDKLGIATIAKSTNKTDNDLVIDLSEIGDYLVKRTNYKEYINNYGNYHEELIINS
jgi:hypothetical protein